MSFSARASSVRVETRFSETEDRIESSDRSTAIVGVAPSGESRLMMSWHTGQLVDSCIVADCPERQDFSKFGGRVLVGQ